MLAGYIVMPPGAALALTQTRLIGNGEPNILVMLLGVVLMFLGAGLVGLGCLLLLKSPQENERKVVRKILIAYGVAIGCLIAFRVFGFGGLDIIKRIAQAYGMYYLINFFEVLASNRQNEHLQQSSNLLNRLYIFGLVGLFAFSLLGAMLGIPLTWVLVAVAVFGVLFYGLWIRTLLLAIKSTSFIPADSTRVMQDG